MKIKNIELPLADGTTVRGDTIVDPTWNLANHRFGSKPDLFCIGYEDAREKDIDSEGEDTGCHKNDEKLQNVHLRLDEESLRELFKRCDIKDDEVIVIGDSGNDIPMLDEFPNSFAMKSAPDYVKSHAKGLINYVTQNTKVPYIETGAGVCNIYVDESADFDMALNIINNAKTSNNKI